MIGMDFHNPSQKNKTCNQNVFWKPFWLSFRVPHPKLLGFPPLQMEAGAGRAMGVLNLS